MPTPEEIRNQEFLVTLRGYDRDEVSGFLNDVAGDQQRLRSRIDELEAQVRRLEAITGEREPRELFRELGEETTRILVSAEEAAQHMRREAEEAARNELETARRTAADELDAARSTAASELEQARRVAQRAIDDANRHREVVADAVDRVSATIHELIATRARLDVGLRGAVESAESAASDLREMPAEVPAGPDAPAPEAADEAFEPPEPVVTDVDEPVVEEVDEPVQEVEEPAVEEVEEPAVEEVEEPAVEEVEEPAVEEVEEIEEVEEPLVDEVDEPFPEEARAADEAGSVTVEEAFVQEAFAEEAAEAPTDEAVPAEAPAERPPEEQPPTEAAAADDREEVVEEVEAGETVAAEEVAAEPEPEEPAEEPADEPRPEPAATVVAGDDEAFEARSDTMATIRPGMLRRLKRALHEIQDGVLENLRDAGQNADAAGLLPGDDDVVGIEEVGDVFLVEAYRSGLRLGAELAAVEEPDDAGDEASAQRSSRVFRDTVVRELRTSLEATLRAGLEAGEDTASLSERAGQVFRDLKGPIAEATVDASLMRTYELGVNDLWRQAGVDRRVWVLGEEMRCPENRCAGNADEGVVGVDQDFPSGDLVPPAHPGCTCTVRPG